MEPDQAWRSALGQLEMEMPKPAFDTWVRDTCVLSFEADRFTIGVRNSYTREWLESRLSSTVQRLLMGIINREVDVEFKVDPELEMKSLLDDEEEDGADVEDGQEEDKSNNQEGDDDPENALAPDQVEIQPTYGLLYDEIVQPEHVTLVSRYFLRHLRVLGPDLGWLYFGFRQAAYNTGARGGSRHARFTGQAIASMSGITERTFWNRIGNPETWDRLHGLVGTSNGSPEWDTHSVTPRRLPRRYTVAMTLPLTAVDARSLRNWLSRNVKNYGGPELVVEAAAKIPLDELLPLNAESQEGDRPESVSAILSDLFKDQIPADQMLALTTRLHKAIMPDNDLLGVTHFFVEHILPHLGAGPGWMLTLLRDRCYKNKETCEMRDQARVAGGYAEIAGSLGLLRPKTVWEWLRDPIVQVYLQGESSGMGENKWMSPRTFHVLLNEIPAEILKGIIGQDEWRDFPYRSGAVFSIGVAQFSESSGANFSIAVARISQFGGAIFRVFKSLNHLNPITNDSPSPLPALETVGHRPTLPKSSVRGVGNMAFWDFNFLMSNNSVARVGEIRRRQKETGAAIERLAQGFVSWLLYAYSPSGQRVTDPIALAAKRLLENVSSGAGGDFDRLAKMRPYQLKTFFDLDLEGRMLLDAENTLEREIYLINFKDLNKPKKRELYRRLFGNQ